MITMETDRLVDDYLQRLEAAAAHLQRSRRTELIAEIREHIEAALREERAADEVAVRNVLERLGPPEEIVQAAEPPPSERSAHTGKLEIAALVTMVFPFVGWLIGIVLVLVSQAWSGRDKAIGVALALFLPLVPIILTVTAGERGMEESVPLGDDRPVGLQENTGEDGLTGLEVGLLALAFFAGLPSALYLGWRLRRHPSTPTH